jgi:hypothetical protein
MIKASKSHAEKAKCIFVGLVKMDEPAEEGQVGPKTT